METKGVEKKRGGGKRNLQLNDPCFFGMGLAHMVGRTYQDRWTSKG
jgi:hypothetical protein